MKFLSPSRKFEVTSVNANAEPQHAGDMAAQIALALDNLKQS